MFDESKFEDYCRLNGVPKTADQYRRKLCRIEKVYNISIEDEYKKDACVSIMFKIDEDKDVATNENDKHVLKNWHSYVQKYIDFRNAENSNM